MFKVPWKLVGLIVLLALILFFYSRYEGFKAGEPGIRCGKDLHACSSGTQCLNGFCGNTNKPALLANQLPVFP
jgi:hypothetical protein